MSQAVESAILTIQDYISSLDTFAMWCGYNFEEISYSRTAAKEILRLLRTSHSEPPLDIIGSFRDEMDKLSRLNKHTKYVFEVGRDTAESIIDFLI